VYVIDNSSPSAGDTLKVQMREVTTGVSVDNETEIKEGLMPGEAVVVQGQQFLTDGVSVRIVGGR
jgi:multidrug efflux pump subunit AcrA (membrane-fusion protein)